MEPSPRPRHTINPPVFFSAALIALALVIFGAGWSDLALTLFERVRDGFVANFGWLYLLSVAVFLLFGLFLAMSSYGDIRLGPDHSEPDYSYASWFAMLFSAGMGIGLLYFGVAEPINHYVKPPVGDGGDVAAAREAMSITFFHWGLHAWAIYAIVGLSLAYFGYRHRLPLAIRSSLYPLIGERIHGPIGHTVDTFAVIGTLFGVATSLGLGVQQVNSGLNYLFDVPVGAGVQIGLIAFITLLATASVVAGLDSGIKRLSELNLLLALALLAFVLAVGPTLHLMQALVQNIGLYLSEVVDKTFNLYAYEPTDWIGGWTLFYWAWWIAWSPFVGMFIARVSRGRTIREFVLGVLFVPVGFTFMWMTFFGNTAIWVDMHQSVGVISEAVLADTSTALFILFEQLPWSLIASTLATLLVVTFFVTSSDSGSLVIDIITSKPGLPSPVWQRIFWAVTEGVVAAVLLLAGGLAALQAVSIASALPFAIIMLVMCYGLLSGLRMERLKRMATQIPATPSHSGGPATWRQRLRSLVDHPNREQALAFLHDTVKVALGAAVRELSALDARAKMEVEDDRIAVTVYHEGQPEFLYAVKVRGYATPHFAFPESEPVPASAEGAPPSEPSTAGAAEGERYYRAEVYMAEGSQRYDLMGCTREQVLADFIAQYERHAHFLHLTR